MTQKSTSTIAIAATLALTSASWAVAQNTVTLQSQDQAVNLTGELVSFEDDVYVIKTNLGSLRISADRVECSGPGCPQPPAPEVVAEAVFTPGVVKLRSVNGSTEIEGILQSFENETYLIETGFGTLQIAASDAECVGEACPSLRVDSLDVKIAASSDLSGGLVTSLIAGFAEFNKLGLVDEDLGSNETGLYLASADGTEVANLTLVSASQDDTVEKLATGGVDLAATARSVFANETAAEIDGDRIAALAGAKQRLIALDAITLAVSPGNPVIALSQDLIDDIFSGVISDWGQLGRSPGAINLYVRDGNSSTGRAFDQLVMTPAGAQVAASATVLNTDADISNAVLNDPNGIGFTSFSQLAAAKPLKIKGVCGILVPATEFTIKTEEYPLTRRIYMYEPETSIPRPATDFVNFATSTLAENIVKASGYIGQDVTSVTINEQGLRFLASILPSDVDASFGEIQSMVGELSNSSRLSLTFRFEPGSATLDSRAQSDVLRLADMLKSGAFDNQELVIAGFTDSVGVGEINKSLSQARAEQVRNSILAAAGLTDSSRITIDAVGYGEMSPLGCNETFAGRAINRRVEVWAREVIGTRTQ